MRCEPTSGDAALVATTGWNRGRQQSWAAVQLSKLIVGPGGLWTPFSADPDRELRRLLLLLLLLLARHGPATCLTADEAASLASIQSFAR
jgi:hypothetical protein